MSQVIKLTITIDGARVEREDKTVQEIVKKVCPACLGRGNVTPILSRSTLRFCALCGSKGYFLVKNPITPVKGLLSRFKTFLGF